MWQRAARYRQAGGILGRFGTVGVVAALIDIALSNLLFFVVGLGPVTAKFLSVAAGTTVAFFGNQRWTFRHRRYQRTPTEQFVRFWVANVIGLLVNVAVVQIADRLVQLDDLLTYNLIANVLGIGLASALRLLLYSRWVFHS